MYTCIYIYMPVVLCDPRYNSYSVFKSRSCSYVSVFHILASAYSSRRFFLYISMCSGVPHCCEWISAHLLINRRQCCHLLISLWWRIPQITRSSGSKIKLVSIWREMSEIRTPKNIQYADTEQLPSSVCPLRLKKSFCPHLQPFCCHSCFSEIGGYVVVNSTSHSVSLCPLVVKQVNVFFQQSATIFASVCFV